MKGAKKWEDGRLGESEAHARLMPEAAAALDDAMELQLISIRLQKSLIDNLKTIAAHHGIGYQPMIRDLLNRFAVCEMKQIISEKKAELERQGRELERQQQGEPASTPPVESFMQKHRA